MSENKNKLEAFKRVIQCVVYVSCFVFFFLSCKQNSNLKTIESSAPVKSESKKCFLDEAENTILELQEVKIKAALIDSISKHKSGISFMPDSLMLKGVPFYEIKTGYNSEIRFESYYTFYVEKGDCDNIKILEPIEGDIVSLLEWRKNKE